MTANKMKAAGFELIASSQDTQTWAKGNYTARLHFSGRRLVGVYRTYADQSSVSFRTLAGLIASAR